VLIVLAVGVAALGYHQGWYTVTTDSNGSPGVTVDKEKFNQDKEKAKTKLDEIKGRIKDKAAESKKEAPAPAPGEGQK
jgi:hypothetical protein